MRSFIVLVGLLFTGASQADTFSLAGSGTVDYTTTVRTAALRCKDLEATSNFDYSILDAVEIAARDNVPAHCRVSALVPGEVRFELNMPLAWNGRLYMYGNGGLAGTPAIDPTATSSPTRP